MIGIFDSGRGGIASLTVVKKLLPRVDIAYLADRKNAPYGTKSERELKLLVRRDIARLRELGAEKILIACCTASSIYYALSESEQVLCVPIIEPTAKYAASLSENGRISVIATEATVRSGSFSRAIKRARAGAEVFELACQRLVGMIENLAKDDVIKEEILKISHKIRASGCDTLVLGCTHFSHAESIFRDVLGDIKIADSAAVGALAIADKIKTEENGKILYM